MKDYSVIIENLMDEIITNFEEAYDYGYDQGYEDGLTTLCDRKENMKGEYNRGLNDAWEAARKICTNWCISDACLAEIFGKGHIIDDIMRLNSASEAIAKIKAYEEQQKQDAEQVQDIQVGDEVNHQGLKSVVVRIADDCIYTLSKCGTTPKYYKDDNLVKTGRRFDQIAEVLEKMRGEE